MNYNDLLDKLDNYHIKKDKLSGDTIIYVYPKNNDGSANLDVGVILESSDGKWYLYEIQRDKKFELNNFSKKEIGHLALYVAVKGKFEKVKGDYLVKNELRKLEKDLVDGKTILQKSIKENYFSLLKENEGTINLIENNQSFDVFYLTHQKEKIMITEGRPISSALVVLYNFGIKLEEFDKLIKPHEENIELKELEKMKILYIGK
ncbi:hypothetical protein AB3Z07_08325 [Metabacillus halosaccharovorans]|uniref:hypothetical protein n=1 Tax=Metabacillus halosaccharovorans TaxID=930124 RepID=UPI000994BCB1|nr:hypothetical protein [Metabacillus halosaccharovorans]MCM3441605.1 hypothetical protein [Metabacillus halosaccharovorans]